MNAPFSFTLRPGFYYIMTSSSRLYYGPCIILDKTIKMNAALQRIFTHINGKLMEAWKSIGSREFEDEEITWIETKERSRVWGN